MTDVYWSVEKTFEKLQRENSIGLVFIVFQQNGVDSEKKTCLANKIPIS